MILAAYPRMLRAAPLVAGLLLAVSIAEAADISPPSQAPAATAIERKADLALWRKSGAADLQSAASYDSSMADRYSQAYQQYLLWRNGPEFLAEVQKQGGGTSR